MIMQSCSVIQKEKTMPIINRGTWTRVFSIRTLINNFIEKFKEEDTIQIISLGGGLDTSFFYFEENHDLFREINIKYCEVDLNDITKEKITVIKENSILQNLIFKDESAWFLSDDSLISNRYWLIPWDIKETELLQEKLKQAGVNFVSPTLVLMECILWYMNYNDTEKVLNFISANFECNVAAVIYEMTKPYDMFGQTMILNLEERGIYLPSLKEVPNEETQITRLTDWNFK